MLPKPVNSVCYRHSEYDYAFIDARIALQTAPRDCWLRMIFDGRYKYITAPGYRPMLFDLGADPQEFTDLGGDPAYEAERQRLEKLLLAWALQPRQRVTITDGALEAVAVQRNISQSGILIGYYNEQELETARAGWKPIFAAFNPIWAKAMEKLSKG